MEDKISQFLKSKVQKVTNYFDPSSNGGNNFWSTNVANTLGEVQNRFNSGELIKPIQFNSNDNLITKGEKFVANIPIGLANSVYGKGLTATSSDMFNNVRNVIQDQPITPYSQLNSGLSKLGYQTAASIDPSSIARTQAPKLGSIKQTLGNAASGVMPIIDAYIPEGVTGFAKEALDQTGKQSVKTFIKEALIKNAKPGAAYGFLTGLADSKDEENNLQYLFNVGANTTVGSVLSALLGTGVEGSVFAYQKAKSKIASVISQKFGVAPKVAEEQAGKFIRNELGQFAGLRKQETSSVREIPQYENGKYIGVARVKDSIAQKEAKFYGDIREALGLPRNGVKNPMLDASGEINVGLKTRAVTPEERIKTQEMFNKLSPEEQAKYNLNTNTNVVQNPQEPFFNVNRVGVDNTTKQGIADMVQSQPVKGEIEKTVGSPLTFKEVQDQAKVSKELGKTFTRADAEKVGAEALALRNKVAELGQMNLNDDQFKEALIKDKAFGQYLGRLFGQRRIVSNPAEGTLFNDVVSKILKNGVDPETVFKEAKNVDFNNSDQVGQFYRKFIQAKAKDWVDVVRFNSMLSSPNTWINNASSNAQGTGLVAPIEKTITGSIDWLASTLNPNRKRQAFAGEGVEYAKGYIKNLSQATDNFWNAITGKSIVDQQEIRNIPLSKSGTMARKVENALNFPGRILQATDEFFQTATKAGIENSLNYRASKGTDVKDISSLATKEARKRLFNSDFNLKEDGPLLKAIEFLPMKVAEARSEKSPAPLRFLANYTFPFVRIPSNILKASVEYSPAGLLTIPGAGNKTEQLSKSIMGIGMALAGGMLASSGRLTFAEPTNEKQKNEFRAAGLQPYAVKIGDRWVSYSKFHPVIAFNLALAAAYKDSVDKKTLDQNQMDTAAQAGAKWLNFFADQSYVKNLGDLVSGIKGDQYSIGKMISNYPQQLIPYRALLSWVNRLYDPYQRQIDPDGSQADKFMQSLMSQIPGLAQMLKPRVDSKGNPIMNQNRELNAFSPFGRVTNENPNIKASYETMVKEAQQKRDENKLKDQLKKGVSGGGNGIAELNGKVFIAKQRINTDTGEMETYVDTVDPTAYDKQIFSPLNKNQVIADLQISKKISAITSKSNDLIQLAEIGKISEADAVAQITHLQELKKTLQTIRASIKPKKARIAKPKFKKVKVARAKPIKLKTIKIRKV